jgi:hypothetical protein
VTGCPHVGLIRDVTPVSEGCADCIAIGGVWVHLRMCMTCGYVGCCDSSPNRHASRHARAVEHPIARTIEPGEDWVWCYFDEVVLDPD